MVVQQQVDTRVFSSDNIILMLIITLRKITKIFDF